MTSALAPRLQDDARELALLKAVGLDRLAPEQRELALSIAQRYELDLMLKHLVMIEGRPYITRDGLLHVAHRSGQLDGMETTSPTIVDGFWRVECSVYRKDMSRPFTYTGRYPTQGGNQKYAPEMAVKVAEVQALRRAFDVSAPTLEERWEADIPAAETAPKPTLAERASAKAAEVVEPVTNGHIEGEAVEIVQEAPPAREPRADICGARSPYGEDAPGCNLAPDHGGRNHAVIDAEGKPLSRWPI
jgi:hypothetical protein